MDSINFTFSYDEESEDLGGLIDEETFLLLAYVNASLNGFFGIAGIITNILNIVVFAGLQVKLISFLIKTF